MRFIGFLLLSVFLLSLGVFAAGTVEKDLLYDMGYDTGVRDAETGDTMNLYGMNHPRYRLQVFKELNVEGMNPLNFDMFYYLKGYRFGYYSTKNGASLSRSKGFLNENNLNVAKSKPGVIGTNVRRRYTDFNLYSLSPERGPHSRDLGYRIGFEDGRSRSYKNPYSLYRTALQLKSPNGRTYEEIRGLEKKKFIQGYGKGYSAGTRLNKVTTERNIVEVLDPSRSVNTDKEVFVFNVRGKYN